MSASEPVTVPDIGDLDDVPVIEIHVAAGDTVSAEDPLITLESDKATMDVPAPHDGVVGELVVSVGDRVSQGSLLLTLQTEASDNGDDPTEPTEPRAPAEDPDPSEDSDHDFQVVVLGSGPGGYTAAFRAADLGLKVALVERHERLGGVCLNVGCIPSKALLHAAKVIGEAQDMAAHGITFGDPEIDLPGLIDWKQSVVDRLTGGLGQLAKQRSVEVIRGDARLSGPHTLQVDDASSGDGGREVSFDNCIIAAGSESAQIPGLPDDPRIIDSTGALSPDSIPGRMLVIGGGIIGLEMACVYEALGTKVTVVEMLDQLIAGADPDLVKPLAKR